MSSQAKAAELKLSATQADYDAIALSVASETARTYIALLGLDAQLQQAKATSTSRTEALRLAQEKFDAGYISQLELTQAQSELEAVAQHIPQLELAISRHHNSLRLLSGELPAAYEQSASSTLSALELPAPGSGLPSELLRRRPDIARAELGLASKDASMAASRAAFLPQVSLSARAGALYVSALSYDPTKPAQWRGKPARQRSIHADQHAAAHIIMEALGEVIWEAQRLGTPLNNERYIELILRHSTRD